MKRIRNISDGIVIHTLISSPEHGLTTSHLLEGKDEIVVIDTQHLPEDTLLLKENIDKIGKKIKMVIISHSHPDHCGSLHLFKKTPIVTSPVIMEDLQEEEEKKKIPFQEIGTEFSLFNKEGQEVIISVIKINGTEADQNLIFKFPSGDYILQDLLFNHSHPYLSFPIEQISGWINFIHDFQDNSPGTVFVGHGFPFSEKDKLNECITYLYYCKELLETPGMTKDDYYQQVITTYPAYQSPEIIKMYLELEETPLQS